jgi:plastocyanin
MIRSECYCLPLMVLVLGGCGLRAQTVNVKGRVILETTRGRAADSSSVVVWLNLLNPAGESSNVRNTPAPGHYKLLQKNKRFVPHILVVPLGAVVDFPNNDPFFHNVFSLFDGKRFDLGLYEAGTTRAVNFNSPGVSYIFCNIHPQMSAIVIVTKSPYYAISSSAGDFAMSNVAPGRYQLNVWYERCLPETLKNLSREVEISSMSSSLGEIRLAQSGNLLAKHKNLYGRDYEPPPSAASYNQP